MVSRRELIIGTATATAAVSLSAGAFAAPSPDKKKVSSTEARKVIDEVLSAVAWGGLTAYWTEPSDGLANGFSKVPSFNLINLSDYALTVASPWMITFSAVRADGTAARPNGPLLASTSWGKTSRVNRNDAVDEQAARTWTWTAKGLNGKGYVPAARRRGGDNIADMAFSTGTTWGGIKIRATLSQAPVLYPSLQEIEAVKGVSLAGESAYYANAIKAQPKSYFHLYDHHAQAGKAVWRNNGDSFNLPGGTLRWSEGESFWSTEVGNFCSEMRPIGVVRGQNADGIF